MGHYFGEHKTERSMKSGKDIPVWETPKFIQARAKAIETIESGKFDLTDADYWILMNETRTEKMAYTGLILSHNGCLKINDHLPSKDQFRAECVSIDKEGFGGSLVFIYCCPDQMLFEVGEVNTKNCKNDYPYAMAEKRLQDRVILKNSKLAYYGIYSEAESEEFKDPQDERPEEKPEKKKKADKEPEQSEEQVQSIEEANAAISARFALEDEIEKLAAETDTEMKTILAQAKAKKIADIPDKVLIQIKTCLLRKKNNAQQGTN